ncbi:MAG: MurR/RpiR family transcriptional regulator [Variibacter sp.]|nr:MurR/RpiR family transcriptional regulator [Variibacter sp.]
MPLLTQTLQDPILLQECFQGWCPDAAPPMNVAPPLIKAIEARATELSPAHRRLARHVMNHWQGIAFSTGAELARSAKVSEATVNRFATLLGFGGYPGLQKEVRRLVRADLKGTDRLQLAAAHPPAGSDPLEHVVAKELENITHLRSHHDPAALRAAATTLRGARRVLVIGARSTAALAFHLWFALDKLGLDAARSLSADTEATDRIGRMDGRDAVVVIGFPRYLRTLVAALELAASRGIPRIVVTDSPFSALKGDIALHSTAESASFVAFQAAPLILLNALIEEVAALDRPSALRALAEFEAVAGAEAYFLPPA